MRSKTCRKCGQSKTITDFYRDAARSDGHGVYCRPCNKAICAAQYEKRYGSTHPLKKLRSESATVRFEASYIPEPNSGCWLWLGVAQGSNGYGRINVDGRGWSAHRYAWTIHRGAIPSDALVLHRCDNPACVNPSHLFLGSSQDNSDDKKRKGRDFRGEKASALRKATAPRGESCYLSKLTEKQVRQIREDLRPQRMIAADFGTSQQAVHYIKTRKTWSHI